MKEIIFLLVCILTQIPMDAQIKCNPTSDKGSAYQAFRNIGIGVENPDCKHKSFGSHITQIRDTQLHRNVFLFHSHIEEDNDRCINLDRVRTEVKGSDNAPIQLQHTKGEQSFYRWNFRLDENFQGSNTFCHIFQNKGKGGDNVGYPILTITARKYTLEARHSTGTSNSGQGKLVEVNLLPFKGKWIEAYVHQTHSHNGTLEILLRETISGDTLMSYQSQDIDLWRDGADLNRPKWGIYRKKNDELKDEVIRFSNFCISEKDSLQCPSETGLISTTKTLATFESHFTMFPNPCHDLLTITSKYKTGNITVFSMDGMQIGESTTLHTINTISLSTYPKGIYLLQIKTKDKIFTEKFMRF